MGGAVERGDGKKKRKKAEQSSHSGPQHEREQKNATKVLFRIKKKGGQRTVGIA